MNKDFKTRTLTTPNGIKVTYFNQQLHNWDGPSIKYPKNIKKKNEYHLYGIPYSKEDWMELRKDRNGVPPAKNSQVKTRH